MCTAAETGAARFAVPRAGRASQPPQAVRMMDKLGMKWGFGASRPAPLPQRPLALVPTARGRQLRAKRPGLQEGCQWSQAGSNRRPPACKGCAGCCGLLPSVSDRPHLDVMGGSRVSRCRRLLRSAASTPLPRPRFSERRFGATEGMALPFLAVAEPMGSGLRSGLDACARVLLRFALPSVSRGGDLVRGRSPHQAPRRAAERQSPHPTRRSPDG